VVTAVDGDEVCGRTSSEQGAMQALGLLVGDGFVAGAVDDQERRSVGGDVSDRAGGV